MTETKAARSCRFDERMTLGVNEKLDLPRSQPERTRTTCSLGERDLSEMIVRATRRVMDSREVDISLAAIVDFAYVMMSR